MYPYEGMFLVDPIAYGADPEAVEGLVRGLLEKHGARIEQFERWDERKLAYEIKGHKRGVYLLVHFEMAGENVAALREDCRLQPVILRKLLVRLDDDIPAYLAKSAKYYEKIREDQEVRRGGPRREADERAAGPAGVASTGGSSPAPVAVE